MMSRKAPENSLEYLSNKLLAENTQALLDGRAVPFTEDFKWPGHRNCVLFDHTTYTEWLNTLLPELAELPVVPHTESKRAGIPVGKYLFYNRLHPLAMMASLFPFSTPRPVRADLAIFQRDAAKAYCRFTAPVGIPVLAGAMLNPWMSLTPSEIYTQRHQIKRAKGNVGMAGLGMGWAARRVLERKQVTSLTVYEHEEAVAEYFGERLKKEFGDRLTIVVGDAYKADWMVHDVALWDIWEGYGSAGDDRRYCAIRDAMRNAGKVCAGWGDFVCRD